MSPSNTTIKVSKQLRDRLAERADRENATLAEAIEHALDEAEEHEFWVRVRWEHLQASPPQSDSAFDSTLRDDLNDPSDEAIARNDAW